MKSGLAKRLLSLVLTAALFMGNVMPVMAEGNATVSGNDIVNTEAVVADVNQPEVPVESKSVQDIVVAGVAHDIVVNDEAQTPVTEETVSENEISTEEVTEEIVETDKEVVSENEIPEEVIEETTETGEESISMNEIPEEEVPLAGTLPVSLEPVTVNGITITVSGPASAFAEGTTVSAVEVEPAEVVIEAAEAEEQAKVMRFKAFDINLLCNGEFVQPLNGEEITVNFEGDLLIPDSEKEEVVVYHVDENDDITKMEAEVATVETEDAAEVETVEMTTTHFSTYVVMVTGEGSATVEVTVNHYLLKEKVDEKGEVVTDRNGNIQYEDESKATPLFVHDKEKVDRNGTIENFVKDGKDKNSGEQRYIAKSLVIDGEKKDLNGEGNYSYTVNPEGDTLTINVYYAGVSGNIDVPVAFIDYEDHADYWNFPGTATDPNSINYYKNYPSYQKLVRENPGRSENWLKRMDEDNWDDRFACKGAYPNYVISTSGYTIDNNGNKIATRGAEVNNYNNSYNTQIIEGLLECVQDNNGDGKYETVKFKYEDPGFFTNEPKAGKEIVDGYKLEFDRTGIQYTLKKVIDGDGVTACEKLNEFFPLNKLKNGQKNEYFGMRYEYKFSIGDYVGDMTYTFSGDDDLWVCLDGEVILDIGGIHQKVSGTVDVWEKLIGKTGITYDDKVRFLENKVNAEREHTITIIYMERGGSDSNCNMKFVMPNLVPTTPDVTEAPVADLNLLKQNSKTNDPISDVKFKLYTDAACMNPYPYTSEVTTNVDGKASYTSLPAGTYYLKETDYDEVSYIENTTVYKVSILQINKDVVLTVTDLAGNSIESKNEENKLYYVIKNTPFDPIELQFTKVDKFTNANISDAKFTLREKDAKGAVIAENIVADADGVYKYSISKAGTYYLEETTTPDGYKIPDKGWTIKVEAVENGTKLSYSITDGPDGLLDAANKIIKNEPYASIMFTKVDAKTDVAIDGAVFKLYNYSNNKAGEELQTATSETVGNNKGTVKFDGLTIGQKYLLEETTAAEGYIAPTNPWIVEVVHENGKLVQKIYEAKSTDNGSTWTIDKELTDSTKIENTPALGSLTIEKTVTKVDTVHGTAGFIFKIECPDNKTVLYRTISFTEAGKKSVTIADLPFGDYKVIELKSLRYQANDGVVEKVAKINSADGATVSYTNDKVFEKLYSHTDVKVNKVVFNADGSVTCNNQDITSTSDKTE